MDSLVKNAADEEQVKAASKKEKFGREREVSDLCFVLGTLAGRRFVHRILQQARTWQLSYAGPGQAEETAFREGMRNIGNWLWSEIEQANPEALLQIKKESKGDQNE